MIFPLVFIKSASSETKENIPMALLVDGVGTCGGSNDEVISEFMLDIRLWLASTSSDLALKAKFIFRKVIYVIKQLWFNILYRLTVFVNFYQLLSSPFSIACSVWATSRVQNEISRKTKASFESIKRAVALSDILTGM